MKKIGLLALISIFGLSGLTFSPKNAELVNNNPKIVEKRNENTGLETTNPAFDIKTENLDIHDINGVELNAFVLSSNIIEGTGPINYESLKINFDIDGYDLSSIDFTDDENCLKVVKTEANENGYSAIFKAETIPADKMTVLTISVKDKPEIYTKINVHFVDAYFNMFDKYVVKPQKVNDKNLKFDFLITEGSEVSNIEKSELKFKEISNEDEKGNNVVSKKIIDLNFNQTKYEFEALNLGTATYEIAFERTVSKDYTAKIRTANLTIKIIESNDYYFFELDERGENLVEVETSEAKAKQILPNQNYTFYVGNNTSDFDPRDYELKATSDKSAFRAIELRNDVSLGIPLLKIVLITNNDSRNAQIDIGFKKSKEYKSLYFDINQSKYSIDINEGLLSSPYYINDNIDFSTIDGLIEVTEGNKKLEIIPSFSSLKKLLGRQRIYVKFDSIGKTVSFDVDVTLNPKHAHGSSTVSTSAMVSHFKNLIQILAFGIPPVYQDAAEAYKVASDEYKFLSSNAKKELIDDYDFIKTYRKFISQNEFQESFFEGIIVKVDISRYIVPTVTLFGMLIAFGIVLGVSLHTIYNKKGDKEDE